MAGNLSSSRFLLAKLHLDTLDDKITVRDIRMTLDTLPKGLKQLAAAYDETVARIERQDAGRVALAKRVFCWITHARRPLTAAQLQEALAVTPGDAELDRDNLVIIDEMVAVCAGLVTVDVESDVVRLIHYTTDDYFRNNRVDWLSGASKMAASTCLTYLSFAPFSGGCCNSLADYRKRIFNNAFFLYAARYWGRHALKVQKAVRRSAVQLLLNGNVVGSISQADLLRDDIDTHKSSPRAGIDFFDQQLGIHHAARDGLDSVVLDLISAGMPPNALDVWRRTPLYLAAAQGHEAVVVLLLSQKSVDVNAAAVTGETPLHRAAVNGHAAVVRLLLERRDVDPNAKAAVFGLTDETPLSLAALEGHEAVVKLLLDRKDVRAGERNNWGRTPLCWAVLKEHVAVVKLLLGRRDVDVNFKDVHGRTPLSHATVIGNVAIVSLLLSREDVDPNPTDDLGLTPLSWTAARLSLYSGQLYSQREALMRLLLGRRDVRTDSRDKEGRTPLSLAAGDGCEVAVKLLLLRAEGVDVNARDNDGQTPLSWAARNGHNEVVKLLLENEAIWGVDDKFGLPPQFLAATSDHQGVRELQLGRRLVHVDAREHVHHAMAASTLQLPTAVVPIVALRPSTPVPETAHGQTRRAQPLDPANRRWRQTDRLRWEDHGRSAG